MKVNEIPFNHKKLMKFTMWRQGMEKLGWVDRHIEMGITLQDIESCTNSIGSKQGTRDLLSKRKEKTR